MLRGSDAKLVRQGLRTVFSDDCLASSGRSKFGAGASADSSFPRFSSPSSATSSASCRPAASSSSALESSMSVLSEVIGDGSVVSKGNDNDLDGGK
jgi:hypothetical protein